MKRLRDRAATLLLVIGFSLMAVSSRSDAVQADRTGNLLNALEMGDTAKIAQVLHDDPSLIHVKLDKGETLLSVAVKEDMLGPVVALLVAGADVNAKDNAGVTPLMTAAAQGNEPLLALLIVHGADVNAKDAKGETPLAVAVGSNLQEEGAILLLLAHGAEVNARNAKGFTPLRASVEAPDVMGSDAGFGLVQILLQKGGSYGNAFLDAVAHGDLPALKAQARANPRLINARYTGLTPLDQAIFWQNVDVAKWLLSRGADVNAKNDRGETPLIQLLAEMGNDRGDAGLTSLLLTHHADPNIAGRSGQTPLVMAATMSGLDKRDQDYLLGLLISHGAKVNAPDGNSGTVLAEVTGNDDKNAAHFLLAHGASYRSAFLDAIARGKMAAVKAMLTKKPALAKTTDGNGNSAAEIALFWGQKPILSFLFSHEIALSEKDGQGYTILINAVKSGDVGMVAFLLSKGAQVNVDDGYQVTPLSAAVQQSAETNDLRLVTLLLSHGANPRFVPKNGDKNALGVAVGCDAVGVVELLLQKGVDVNDGGNPSETPLHEAVPDPFGRQIAQLLRQHGGRDGSSPLMDAITREDLPAISAAVKATPDAINTVINNETPLAMALYWGNKAVVSLLLDLGADPNKGIFPNTSPLSDLAEAQAFSAPPDADLAALLIARGAAINPPDAEASPDHAIPLIVAAIRDNKPLVALLLKAGTRVDVTDLMGRTPLFYVAERGDEDLVSLLLDNGAMINAKDIEGQTPLDAALQMMTSPYCTANNKMRYGTVADFLRQHGATE